MKILIHGLNYRPELIGVGKYTGEMALWLAQAGHDVRVVTAYPYYPAWRIAPPYRGFGWTRETAGGVRVWRCPVWVPRKQSAGRRVLHLLSFAATSAPVVMWQAVAWRPEVVIGVEPTLLAAPATLMAARLSGASAWLHVQDFEVEAAVATGLVANAGVAKLSVAVEAMLLRRFDRVSAISPAMCAHARGKGVAPRRVILLPNWAAVDEICPLDGPSPMRAELGLPDEAVVALYSGNMSEKQGLETLAATARALEAEPGIRFVFAGEGAARGRLEALSAGLGNVVFLPLQPAERLNDLLNLADIHLLPQRRGVADLVMPSKLLGMMASGRPVVSGAYPETALAEAVASCGLVVPPEDGAAMAAAVLLLARDPAKRSAMGAAGRHRAVAELSRDAVLGHLAQALAELDPAPRHEQSGTLSRLLGSPGQPRT